MSKKKIAVLHAQTPFMRGGAESMVENLNKCLLYHGYESEIISIPFKWYPINALLDSFLMWRMADLSESNGEKIDMVIALKCPTYLVHHPNKVIWLMHQHRAAYDLADNRVVFGLNTIENGPAAARKIKKIDDVVIAEAREVYSISKNVSNRLMKFNKIASSPLYHPPALEGRYYAESYGDYILSVGRLDPSKRVDLLIRALVHCNKRVRAIIAGKGPELDKLMRLAENLAVDDRVKFLGYVSDDELLKLYANALAVCFTPIDEDYGYVTLEAFRSKRPLLTCSDAGGVLEFAEDQKSAFVVDSGAEELGSRMDELFVKRKLAKDMGEYGYQSVKDIAWDHVVDELTKPLR